MGHSFDRIQLFQIVVVAVDVCIGVYCAFDHAFGCAVHVDRVSCDVGLDMLCNHLSQGIHHKVTRLKVNVCFSYGFSFGFVDIDILHKIP